jgi:hypothetical protein
LGVDCPAGDDCCTLRVIYPSLDTKDQEERFRTFTTFQSPTSSEVTVCTEIVVLTGANSPSHSLSAERRSRSFRVVGRQSELIPPTNDSNLAS